MQRLSPMAGESSRSYIEMPTTTSSKLVAERAGARLVIVNRPQPGCGDVITSASAPQLIDGVEAEPLVQFPDDRGCFSELFRFGEPGLARDFNSATGSRIQVSFTSSYPDVIKAIHYHFEQTDLWVPLAGMFQVILYDLRESSRTCGKLNTLFIGTMRPWKLRIPPGVGHGYKVVGPESGMMVYATNRTHNPQDEGRIPFDEPGINYDWASRPR